MAQTLEDWLNGEVKELSKLPVGELSNTFFFRDPLGMHPHEPDIAMLMRLCDVHDVPLATNPATAELLMKAI